uniref:Uncharacterized protein n=1 Tax=Rhabditophanes sp. KR3021 TaxID=114890 RepID=A0AC35UDU7_9BILA
MHQAKICCLLLVLQIGGLVCGENTRPEITSIWGKRMDFDDPRLYSASFGKRSGVSSDGYAKICCLLLVLQISGLVLGENTRPEITSIWGKRMDFDDPRLYSASFGKRSGVSSDGPSLPFQEYFLKQTPTDKRSYFNGKDIDPRIFSAAFGKRSPTPAYHLLFSSPPNTETPVFGKLFNFWQKRSSEIDDPRFYSGAFGKRK